MYAATPVWMPIITAAVSAEKQMQFFHGIFFSFKAVSRSLKILIPVDLSFVVAISSKTPTTLFTVSSK